MTKRSASDVILEMEQTLNTILGHQRNMDANIKILLARSVKQQSSRPAAQPDPIPEPKPEPEPPPKRGPGRPPKSAKFEDLPKTNIFETLKKRSGLIDADLTTEHDELIEEVVHKGDRRGARNPTKPSGKVSVSQQVLNDEGSPIFLASVEILDMNGALIKQTRTNTKGRWVAPLDPGRYAVHITKRIQDKPPVDLKFAVEIPETGKPMELDPPEV